MAYLRREGKGGKKETPSFASNLAHVGNFCRDRGLRSVGHRAAGQSFQVPIWLVFTGSSGCHCAGNLNVAWIDGTGGSATIADVKNRGRGGRQEQEKQFQISDLKSQKDAVDDLKSEI